MRLVIACLCALVCADATAATKGADTPSLLPNANSKAPISVEADHLDYFEKEGKAVYTGKVVVVQGDTKLTCSKLTIFMEKSATSAAASPTPAPTADAGASGAAPAAANSGVKHMDCVGPVSVVSKTQTATADNGSYDKARNNVTLVGNVVMSDGRNVTKGDRLVYDLTSGQAAVQGGGKNQRVTGSFLPGSDPANSANPASGAKKK